MEETILPTSASDTPDTTDLPQSDLAGAIDSFPAGTTAASGGTGTHDNLPEVLITPGVTRHWPYLAELWNSRELLYSLVLRDIKVRYKQTFFGAAWAVFQPLLTMLVFTAIIRRMGVSNSGSVPYPIFVFSGLLVWFFFSRALTTASNSVVSASALITKVYFPRLAIPLASIGTATVDFSVGLVLLLGMMLASGIQPGWSLLLIPLLLLLTAVAALAFGTILAALNVAYRDFRVTVPFLVQIWLLATPAIYLDGAVTQPQPDAAAGSLQGKMADKGSRSLRARRSFAVSLRQVIDCNPLMGLVDAFRAAVLGRPLPWHALAYSSAFVVPLFVIAYFLFRHMEVRFADVV